MAGRPDAIIAGAKRGGLRLQQTDPRNQRRSEHVSTHLLYGDSFLVPRALRTLAENEGATGLLEANSHRLQGSQIKPAELLSLCNALPFMDPRRLVVVEGLLAAYERRSGGRSGGRRGRSRGSGAETQSLGGWEALVEAVPQLPDTTLLVFTDGAISDGNPLLRLLRPICQAQALAAPSGGGAGAVDKRNGATEGRRHQPGSGQPAERPGGERSVDP